MNLKRNSAAIVAVFACGISWNSGSLFAQVTFSSPAGSPYGVGTYPMGVVVADFNKDGQPDFAVANQGTNNVTIWLGDFNGDGGFFMSHSTGAGMGPRAIATGDFNQDTWPDLVVVDKNTSSVAVLINTKSGSGTFGGPVTLTGTFSTPEAVAVGDFDNNGCPDLAVTNFGNNTVSVLLNQKAGTVCTATFSGPVTFGAGASSSGASAIVAGHFTTNNGTGPLDLAIVNSFAATVTVLYGNGAGSFPTSATFSLSPGTRTLNGAQIIAAGDLNGDGYPDLAVAVSSDTVTGMGGVIVLLNDKTGKFPTAKYHEAHAVPASVAIGDFNDDTLPDLVVANAYSHDVSVLLGDGIGGFGSPTNYMVGFLPAAVATGRFKILGDSTMSPEPIIDDVVVANFGVGGGSVSVLLSNCSPIGICP